MFERFMLITGPCVLESDELNLEIARAVKGLGESFGLPVIFKASFDKANRSHMDSARGPGLVEGVKQLATVKEETGLTHLDPGPSLGTIDWYFRLEGDLVHKFCDYFLMASSEGDTTPEVSEGITECRWLPVEDAIAKVAYDNAREVMVRAADVLSSREADSLL